MNKKLLVSILAVVILAFVYTAEAQQPKKVPRIGFLIAATRDTQSARTKAFRQGLQELGYIEGNLQTIFALAQPILCCLSLGRGPP